MKSNVKIYNNSNLDTKVVGYGGSTIPIKIYHNSLDYQTGDFFNITFSVNDSTMWGLSTTPAPDSQLWYQPVAIRFDWDKVRENDLAKWTVTATPLSGYKFSHWLLNWQKVTDSESYVLRDNTAIEAVFITSDIIISFLSNSLVSWYDNDTWDKVYNLTLDGSDSWALLQALQETDWYTLRITNKTKEYVIRSKVAPVATAGAITLNWSSLPSLPYGLSNGDSFEQLFVEKPVIYLESDELWHWEDASGNTIEYYILQNTSGDTMELTFDSSSWKAKIFDRVNTNTIYFVPEKDCEITALLLNGYNNMPYRTDVNVVPNDYITWKAAIKSSFELMNSSTLNALGNNLIAGVSCLNIENISDANPSPYVRSMKYYPRDYRTHYYMWFMMNQKQENNYFSIIAFNDNWTIVWAQCYDYSDNPFWITRGSLLSQWCLGGPYSGSYDYSQFLQQGINIYSTTGIVETIRETLHLY